MFSVSAVNLETLNQEKEKNAKVKITMIVLKTILHKLVCLPESALVLRMNIVK